MANTPNPEQKPKVSKLPLPVSDSPLVIDLPDGQKIVIGKMTQGSVIEVATWRGVGRPDSRTSRLMLGVGSGNVEDDSTESAQQSGSAQKVQKPEGWRIALYYIALVVNSVQSLPWKKWTTQLQSTIKRKPKKKRELSPNPETQDQSSAAIPTTPGKSTISTSSVDDDIEAWLNKITEKASAKSANSSAAGKNVAKKATPAKKPIKKTANPKAKRK